LPRAIEGTLIIGIGHFLGIIARFLYSNLREDAAPNDTVSRMIYGVILIVAVVFGLQQMLIDITFITQLILLPLLIIGLSLALAFGLGAKQYMANLMARSETNRFSIGDRIRVEGMEGEIVEKQGLTVRIETDAGIVSIPAAKFLETTVLMLRKENDDD
jgi:small-conductance mechanosensitive channel